MQQLFSVTFRSFLFFPPFAIAWTKHNFVLFHRQNIKSRGLKPRRKLTCEIKMFFFLLLSLLNRESNVGNEKPVYDFYKHGFLIFCFWSRCAATRVEPKKRTEAEIFKRWERTSFPWDSSEGFRKQWFLISTALCFAFLLLRNLSLSVLPFVLMLMILNCINLW